MAREFVSEAPEEVAWGRYIQALMLANEFVFID